MESSEKTASSVKEDLSMPCLSDESCSPPSCMRSRSEAQSSKAQLFSSLKNGAIILISSLVVLIAFRNTLTWHLQRFWGASGNFWQSQWDKIYNYCGRDPHFVGIHGSCLLTFVTYYVFGSLYTIVDLTGKPAFILKYKIQEDAPYPVKPSRVLRVMWIVFINQTVVSVPFMYALFPLLQWRGCSFDTLPTFHWVLLELAVFLIMEEIGFYYSHRLFHHPRIYKYVHKQHHEWTAPIAITATYCHPAEHLFANLCPLFMGPLIMGSHIATIWLWLIIAIFNTLHSHSGFHFPFFPSSEGHDYHHLKFTQNYGLLGILDTLHGTNTPFRNSVLYKRHITFTSLRYTIKDLFPDDPKKKS